LIDVTVTPVFSKPTIHLKSSITPRQRRTLIDWLLDMCDDFRHDRDVYFLAVWFLDLSLSVAGDVLHSGVLQCLGVACALLASKIQDVNFATLEAWVRCAGNAFSSKQLIDMEANVHRWIGGNGYVVTEWTTMKLFLIEEKGIPLGDTPTVARESDAFELLVLASMNDEFHHFGKVHLTTGILAFLDHRNCSGGLSRLDVLPASFVEIFACPFGDRTVATYRKFFPPIPAF